MSIKSFLVNKCRDNCSGCGACVQSCPTNCISFSAADDGFQYPVIDGNKCIHCHKCIAVCPYSTEVERRNPIQFFSGKARDIDAQKNSSSGGGFYGLARKTIEDGGVVYGAVMNEDFSCEHRPARNISELRPLMGSKYVQSRCDNVFSDVKTLLKNNIPVLFVGTPCQIAGLRNYLGKETDYLITIDIACHGVPSANELKKCIEWIEKKHNGRVVYFRFRDKDFSGWNHSLTYSVSKHGKTKKYTVAPYEVPYYYFFLHSRNIRTSCYTCPYVGLGRMGDITLADFWAAERIYPESEIGSGVSVILCNTEKGLTMLKRSESYLTVKRINNEIATQNNQPFNTHPRKYPKRDELLREVLINGYDNSDLFYSKKEWAIAALKAAVPEKMKRFLFRNFGR